MPMRSVERLSRRCARLGAAETAAMSSLAAARAGAAACVACVAFPRRAALTRARAAHADNFYYPPDWTPEAGSLNKFAGAPPGNLGTRAKKLDQGILVIRCASHRERPASRAPPWHATGGERVRRAREA